MYEISEFKRLGFYEERSSAAEECNLSGGKIIHPQSAKILDLLNNPGGESYDGDFSRQDSAVITALLNLGHTPSDVYATFSASPRGKHALERKNGHFNDYLERTIKRSLGFVKRSVISSVDLDFSKKDTNHLQHEGLVVEMADGVSIETTQWVWQGYIPAGKLTVLAGDPGMGKSTISTDLVSRISRGGLLPCGSRSVTGTSLIASAEDSPPDTIVPRLIAAKANLSKVGIITEVREPGEVGEHETRYLQFPRDFGLLKEVLVEKGCRMLVVDPLTAFIGKENDTYKDQDMRLVLHPLDKIAYETGTAILVIAHLTKREDSSVIYRVSGSIGFIAAARSVLGVSQTPDKIRVVYSIKSNLSARPPALSYDTKSFNKTREGDEWKGEKQVKSSRIKWLGEIDYDPFNKAIAKKDASEAIDFIKQVLQEQGELNVEIIYKEARSAGVSKASLNQTRLEMGIKAIRRGTEWFWVCPRPREKVELQD